MTFSPAPMQSVALALGILLPLVVLVCAQVRSIHGAGARYWLGCFASAAIFFAFALILPAEGGWSEVVSGFLLLSAAMLFWNVFWNLLAFGFTLTLLTALARSDQPLTRSQWISAYMQGGDLRKFAQNRLQLLLGTGMATTDQRSIVVTPFGIVTARLIRLIRSLFGVQ